MENYQVLCSVTKERARAVPGNKYRHLQAEEVSAYMPWIATIRSALSRRTLELCRTEDGVHAKWRHYVEQSFRA